MPAWLIPALIGAGLGAAKSKMGKDAAKKRNTAAGIANLGGERRQPIEVPSVLGGTISGAAMGALLSGLGTAVEGAEVIPSNLSSEAASTHYFGGVGNAPMPGPDPALGGMSGEELGKMGAGGVGAMGAPHNEAGFNRVMGGLRRDISSIPNQVDPILSSITDATTNIGSTASDLLKDKDLMKNVMLLQAVKSMQPEQQGMQQYQQPIEKSSITDSKGDQEAIAALLAALSQNNRRGAV